MIKRLLITVDGKQYDVLVEMLDVPAQPAYAPAPIAAPVVTSAPAAFPAAAASVPALPTPALASPPAPTGSGKPVLSPLTGRVVDIKVQKGQTVKEGDHVLTLEAMKMNTNVIASTSGAVTSLNAAVGDAVEEGAVLMTIG
ncbi:MAG: biotin/lipoyl-containing protein [Verrucomicrobiota bacterium]